MSSSINKSTLQKPGNPSKPSTSKPTSAKQAPTSHPSTYGTKPHKQTDGPATAAYKSAQMKIPPRQPTPHGSEGASSQACESADVSESERGVMRRERKDVVHRGPGGDI
ncbi:MAG: hypothetical protein Q9176_000714 [Flavoplaca citrina]